jgi:hypothetical protein
MPIDLTRTSDDVRQRYGPPLMQQGRVVLDRDFNALQETLSAKIEGDALDIIGPLGTPDNGFEVTLEHSSPPTTLWSPPLASSPPFSPPDDFFISPGTMYVGGHRVALPGHVRGQTSPLIYSYFDQPDWLSPPPPAEPLTQEVASLLLRQQEVGAVEDPDLLDVALGGPDTTQRLRLMRRIERTPGKTCSAAANAWAARGFTLDRKTMRLLPQVALQVSFTPEQTTQNPCDPIASGGYLGAYNQLIRVQLRKIKTANGKSRPGLIWGYDNASFTYRVSLQADGKTLQLAQAPVDAFHQPVAGQIVEVLRTASILASDPNASDPTQQSKILRCIAQASGLIETLASPYQSGGNAGGTVTLSEALPPEYAGDPQLFLRIWQAQAAVDPGSGSPIPLVDGTGQSTGLQVQITIPSGTKELAEGAYWMIAVRPETPQAVYPERFLTAPQPPDGPRQWLCPLAVIDWTTSTILDDCRVKFCNLVGLTKRERATCCTFRVGDGVNSFGDYTSIQTAIDRLPPQGGEICVLAGRYFEELRLDNCTDVMIHGCGPETRIASPSLQPKGPAASGNSVISIRKSQHLELRTLVVEADHRSVGIQLQTGVSNVVMRDLIVVGVDQPGVSMSGVSLRLERSIIALPNVESDRPAVYAAGREIHVVENWVGLLASAALPNIVQTDLRPIRSFAPAIASPLVDSDNLKLVIEDRTKASCGIQIGGLSRDVYVLGNDIQGGRGNGITLGSLRIIDSEGGLVLRIFGFYDGGVPRDPCGSGTTVVNTTVPPDSTERPGRIVVEGRLANIHIERNRIRNMGLAAIGPVGFFNLRETQEVVSVSELFIIQNEISDCPNQPFTAISDSDSAFVGYAALALPDVVGLVIRDNQILNAGAALSDPVCGIFLLHGEQVEISRNQILDSRDWSATNLQSAAGLRAGISILMVTAPVSPSSEKTYLDGVGALCLIDNVVQVPVGVILSVAGLGAFSIRGNQLTTGGIAGVKSGILAAGVVILNFGTSIEFPAQVTSIATLLAAVEIVNEGANIFTALQLSPALTSIVGTTGRGPVLFSQNRCYVELTGTKKTDQQPFDTISSVFILTFDDLGFQDNQCALVSSAGRALCDVFSLGWTVRATGNRIQEKSGIEKRGPSSVLVSLFTAALGNITALNIASNPIVAIGTVPSDFATVGASNIV